MTLLIGSEGSMGKRYKAILSALGEPFWPIDIGFRYVGFNSSQIKRIIIATPTHTHLKIIKEWDDLGVPILCEKPLSKDLLEVDEILRCKSPLTMMMQYSELVEDGLEGPSCYDFYHHGSDGLVWDCFQIVALAKGEIQLREKSPVWACMINGKQINRSDIDWSYLSYIKKWIRGENNISRDQLAQWHMKVQEYHEQLSEC